MVPSAGGAAHHPLETGELRRQPLDLDRFRLEQYRLFAHQHLKRFDSVGQSGQIKLHAHDSIAS